MRVLTPLDVGLLVRERRHVLRLSQAELASRAGVGRAWLVSVERGHARAELGKLLALLAELGLTLDVSAPAGRVGETQEVDLDALLTRHDDMNDGAP